MVATENKRELVTGGDPDAPFPIPDESMFFDQRTRGFVDFIADESLDRIGRALISRKLAFLDDGEFTIEFRWKRRGGVSKGNAFLGNCVRLSGAARHYAGVHMLVYLAADHLGSWNYTAWQVEALIYHELLKIDRQEKWSKPDKTTGKNYKLPTVYSVLGPEFSGFYQEIREYGLWQTQLAQLADVMQPSLPGFEGSD